MNIMCDLLTGTEGREEPITMQHLPIPPGGLPPDIADTRWWAGIIFGAFLLVAVGITVWKITRPK
jgi:hypothetical protein